MSVKPNNDTLTALARMHRSAEWAVIETWLLERREAWLQASLSDDNTKSRKAQGALLEIDDFLRITKGTESSVSR